MKPFILAVFLGFLCFAQTEPGQGSQTVTTSGVPVQLSTASPPIKATICTITAKVGNTGTIWLGFSVAVSAANKTGTPLVAGAAYACNPVGNAPFWILSSFYLDASNSGDGVSYSWK